MNIAPFETVFSWLLYFGTGNENEGAVLVNDGSRNPVGLHNLIAMTIIAQKLFSNPGKKIVGDTPHQAISVNENNTHVGISNQACLPLVIHLKILFFF